MLLCGQRVDIIRFSHDVLHLTVVAFHGYLIISIELNCVYSTAGVLRENVITLYGDVL